ncbi:hypothetical protein E2C01_102304 [Portunus trituberculatus]|uniref:Uncharacterized protein n=1 Tax=Portunus trituberculatus TaxID=210409 RepID=A0A5B7KGZ3_PORTR|nr:hypothetical protein [Portunus trituberculatus]
MPVLRGSGPV